MMVVFYPLIQHLMTCYHSEVKEGEVIIHFPNHDFKIDFNKNQFKASVEKVKLETLEDHGIISKWGDTIYRINFHLKNPKKSNQIKYTIARME